MSDRSPLAAESAWRGLVDLGRRLARETQLSVQRRLVLEQATKMTLGQADLWLSTAIQQLPLSEIADLFPTSAPSDLMRRALDTQRPCSHHDDETGAVTALALPLIARDKALGVLEVQRLNGPPLSAEEMELLHCLAAQSAVALHSAYQATIERWREEQLALVSSVSAQIANVLDLGQLTEQVTGLILDTFRYYYVALFVMHPDKEVLLLQASAGPTRPQRDDVQPAPPSEIPLGIGIVGHVGQSGLEILANDVTVEPRYRSVSSLPETRAELAMPLKIEDRILGVLDLQSNRYNDFHELDLLVLRSLAENIAIAVEHAQLYGQLHRRVDQISTLADVSRAAASLLDLDALLNQLVNRIQQHYSDLLVHLFTVDYARGQIVHRAGSEASDPLPGTEELAFELDQAQDLVSWVFCHRQSALVNDTSLDPRCKPSALRPQQVRSELVVPLTFGGEVLGVLDIQSDRPNSFRADDSLLFDALADSVAVAVRNANLYRSERWRRQVADSMLQVAGLLSSDMVLEDVLDAILGELERTLPCDLAAICLLEDEYLYVAAARGKAPEIRTTQFAADSIVWIAQALSADQPLIRSPESPSDLIGTAQGFPPDYSAIAATLRAGIQPLGLLLMAHQTPGRYGAESRVIMSAFASYAAVAIENTRIYQSSQEQALVSAVMLQVAEATQSLATLDQVLETIVRLTPMLVGVSRCAVLLWDSEARAMVPAAAYGLRPDQQAAFDDWRTNPERMPSFEQLYHEKAPIVIHDVTADARPAAQGASALGFESLLALPLLAQGSVLGAMLVDYRDDRLGYDVVQTLRDERIALIQGIAHQTAAAIENALLREAQQEEAYVSTALLQVAQTVTNLSELDDILSAIVRIAPILVGVERCILFLWDDDRDSFRPSHTYGISRDAESALLSQRYATGSFPLLDEVRERDAMVLFPQDMLDHLDGALPPELRALTGISGMQTDLRSLLACPLSVKGRVLGALVLEEAQAPGGSPERRLEIIAGIAQQAALAIQNEQLEQERLGRERLERELQLAREIQQTFIPSQLPSLPGWEIAATWRAARQVAGDFYDIFELPDGHLGVVIADVADKGMPAALFMVLTRALMRAIAWDHPSPGAVLSRVNDLLVPDAQYGMFVTAFYAILSLGSGRLTYANAGHNRPLIFRSRTQRLQRLKKGGMALGVMSGANLEDHSVWMRPGDRVILYTDGVTEAFSARGWAYGEKRLRAVIRSTSAVSAPHTLAAIDTSVLDHVGLAPPSDDLTVIVLRREQREPT